jgi:hypothetical protein
MPITVNESKLLDLLEECLPVLDFASGGYSCDETLGKVRLVLELAGRKKPHEWAGESHR